MRRFALMLAVSGSVASDTKRVADESVRLFLRVNELLTTLGKDDT